MDTPRKKIRKLNDQADKSLKKAMWKKRQAEKEERGNLRHRGQIQESPPL